MAIDMRTIIEGVTLTKVCSVKPDGGSSESKQVTVHMKYDGLTLQDVFTKALSSDIIKFQASARKRFDTLGKVENVNAKSPGTQPQLSVMEQFKLEASAEGIDINDKVALTEYITKRLDKVS